MDKIKKQTSQVQAPDILECGIYKDFPLSYLPWLLGFWITMFLMFSGINWIFGGRKVFSIMQCIKGGALAGFLFHFPSYTSALIMSLMRKPILKFNIQGFYYTPQIWSRSRLYQWEAITDIEIEQDEEDEHKRRINVYLSDESCVSINEKILPIYYDQLLEIFRYRLKNVPINVLK